MEIGSEFSLEQIPNTESNETPRFLGGNNNIVLTSSGRGAINLLLQKIHPSKKSALLPAYICESVILPFLEQGYECNYYEVDENLIPNIESIKSFGDIGVFFHMGYYGFPTNSNLEDVLKNYKKKSTLIIEDITHNLFSSFDKSQYNDYYVGSIRKWIGIPSGGFLAYNPNINKNIFEEERLQENTEFSYKRLEALISKREYLRTNEVGLKALSLSRFSEAENDLDLDYSPYCIDRLSASIINDVNEAALILKRKENFITLSEGINKNNNIQPLFENLSESICPMFFPILIKKDRSGVRNNLAKNHIYCPIHWPIPEQIDINNLNQTSNLYNSILSIPCDQRYGRIDMERIISVLESIH